MKKLLYVIACLFFVLDMSACRQNENGGEVSEVADREDPDEEWGAEKEEITTVPDQASSEPVKVMFRTKEPYGTYLVDGRGRAMYMFTADTAGKRTCVGECAKDWIPVITSGKPVIGDEVDKDMVARIRLENGEYQIAYNQRPLYYYAKDVSVGDTKGQDVESFGGEWYLMGPEGRVIDADEK